PGRWPDCPDQVFRASTQLSTAPVFQALSDWSSPPSACLLAAVDRVLESMWPMFATVLDAAVLFQPSRQPVCREASFTGSAPSSIQLASPSNRHQANQITIIESTLKRPTGVCVVTRLVISTTQTHDKWIEF